MGVLSIALYGLLNIVKRLCKLVKLKICDC